MDSIVATIGELFGPIAGLVLALTVVLGGAAMWLQGGALKEPEPDRDRLSDLLAGAEVLVHALSATGHV